MEKLLAGSQTLQTYFDEHRITEEEKENIEIAIKYEHYILKEEEFAKKMLQLDHIKIPLQIDYHQFPSLSLEAREKLSKVQPQNLGQASRISGVAPSDITVLMIFLKKSQNTENQ